MPTNTHRSRRRPSRTAVPEEFRTGSRRVAQPSTEEGSRVPVTEIVPFKTPGFITQRQWEFLCDLLDKKDLLKSPGFFDKVNAMDAEEFAEYLAWLKDRMKYTTRPKASETIDALKALPYKPREKKQEDDHKVPQVPEGRYALHHAEDELNPIRFYRVTRGKDKRDRGGKDWSGAIFLERFASDDTFPVKYRSAEYFRVLEGIIQDPLAAAVLYGNEFGRCCICNRGLTRRLSREMGIGPVCARRQEWVDEAFIEGMRQQIIERGDDPNEKLDQPRQRRHIIGHA